MQNWKRTISAASVCLAMVGAPVMSVNMPVIIRAPEQTTTSKQSIQTISGALTHQDLEGGYYAVAGYRLIGDEEQFAGYLGLQVQVSGTFSDEMSIYMTKAIKVSEIKLHEQQTLTGELTWEELESGFYAVAGYRLIGDAAQFAKFLGQQVVVTGKLSDEVSIFMTKAIEVEDLTAAPDSVAVPGMVSATRPVPQSVTVNGQKVNFSQDPLAQDGILYVPLKSVVKAAGGRVHWSGQTKTATVEMPDRMAIFVVGEEKAEMNENGVRYLVRNLIAMAKAPMLYRGHAYVSADALSTILGLCEAGNQTDATMQLVSPASLREPDECQPTEQESMIGAIRQIETGERTRILFAGPDMQNGEPYLIWLTVSQDTALRWGNRWTKRLVQVSDLQVGQSVEVELTGPLMESYPAQGSASLIVVLEQAEQQADILTGKIQEISGGERTRILVAGPAMQSGEPTLVWVTLADGVAVFRQQGEDRTAVASSELKVGQQVQVALTGPLLLSYPAQGGSNLVVIVEK